MCPPRNGKQDNRSRQTFFWCKHVIIFMIKFGTCNFDKWKIIVNKLSSRWLVLAYHLKPRAEVSGATNFSYMEYIYGAYNQCCAVHRFLCK